MTSESGAGPATGDDAVLAPAMDYIESWLDGDPERMSHCLHPDLVKRSVVQDKAGRTRLHTLTRADMIEATRRGSGRRIARPYAVQILEICGDIAAVRVLSAAYVDLLHLARVEHQWQIVNVLWQHRPPGGQP